MSDNHAIRSLEIGLHGLQLAEFYSWWSELSPVDRDVLEELTRNIDTPWLFNRLPIIDDNLKHDLADDLYNYLVNHEFNAGLPFFGTVSRDGHWGTFTSLILAIPLCDPDWPPYSHVIQAKPWRPRGRLANADLGFA